MKLYNENIQYWRAIHWPFLIVVFAVFLFWLFYKENNECEFISWDSATIIKITEGDCYLWVEVQPKDCDSLYNFCFSKQHTEFVSRYLNSTHKIEIKYNLGRYQILHVNSLKVDDIIVAKPNTLLQILIPSIIGLIGIIGVIFVIKGFRRGDFDELTKNGKGNQQVVEENTVPKIVSKSQARFAGDDYCVNKTYDGVILTVFFNENLVEFCRDYLLDAEINYSDKEIAELVESIRKNPEMYKDTEIVY